MATVVMVFELSAEERGPRMEGLAVEEAFSWLARLHTMPGRRALSRVSDERLLGMLALGLRNSTPCIMRRWSTACVGTYA